MITPEQIAEMIARSIARSLSPEDAEEAEGVAREVQRKASQVQFRASGARAKIRADDDEKRVIPFLASNERVDRAGDIIRVAGWHVDDFMSNAVFLRQHNAWSEPIGRVVSVERDLDRPALMAHVEFPAADVSEDGDRVYRLYRGGFMNAVSVGFRPLETLVVTDEEERQNLGLGKYGVVYVRQELLELSAVSIPANPDAVMQRCYESMICTKAWAPDDTDALEAAGWDVEGLKAAAISASTRSTFDLGGAETPAETPAEHEVEPAEARAAAAEATADTDENTPPDHAEQAVAGELAHAEDPEALSPITRAAILERLATVGLAMNEIVDLLRATPEETESEDGDFDSTDEPLSSRELEEMRAVIQDSIRGRETSGETQPGEGVSIGYYDELFEAAVGRLSTYGREDEGGAS